MKPADLQQTRVRLAFDRFATDARAADRAMHQAIELLVAAADTFLAAIVREPLAGGGDGPDQLLTRAEAAAKMGIHPATLDEYVKNGVVPVRRLPSATGEGDARGMIRFSERDLEAWLLSRSVPARSEAC